MGIWLEKLLENVILQHLHLLLRHLRRVFLDQCLRVLVAEELHSRVAVVNQLRPHEEIRVVALELHQLVVRLLLLLWARRGRQHRLDDAYDPVLAHCTRSGNMFWSSTASRRPHFILQ